jgi:hypothetical protein
MTTTAADILATYSARDLDHVIDLLELEAGNAGDLDMVRICRRALNGDAAARLRCAEVIATARNA